MNIDTQKIKRRAGVAIAFAVVGFVAYWYSASVHKPPIVAIAQTGTGVSAGSAFGIPLATLTATAPGLAISFAPLDAPQAGGTLRLTFDPSVDGRGRELKLVGREVTLADDMLMLPVTFGRDNLIPQRITINYRDGNVTTVRYQGKTTGGSTFQVVRVEPEDLAAEAGTEAEVAAVAPGLEAMTEEGAAVSE